jgi:hypothetical protein
MRAFTIILSARFLLLLGLAGAFVLAVMVKDQLGLWVEIAFAVLMVGPLVVLDYTSRKPPS